LPRRFASGFALGLAALAGLWPVAPARAADPTGPADLCERAIVNGARRGGVPVDVLHAVALNETGRKDGGRLRAWPWAINREGEGFWFATREEALDFAERSLAAGRRSFDVGCVQINYRWHGHAFPSLEAMFDPEWTATYAAQFLRTLYEERGDWTAAAGAYHSLTPELARKYAARFETMLARTRGQTELETLVASAPERLSTRGARREAQRRETVERMRLAGPPAPAPRGGIAGALFAPAGGALFVQGSPLLATPGGPLF
jgi:hypothetical protein